MHTIILDAIPFDVDEKGLMELLRVKPGTSHAAQFARVLGEACKRARPKAAFGIAEAGTHGEDEVEIDSVRFKSRILKANIEKAIAVYPFMATCGTELEEWSQGMTGALKAFWADSIMLMALGCAMSFLESHIKGLLGDATLSTMNPGSLEDWPLSEQEGLFRMMRQEAYAIGIRLTETMVMKPLKSVSGIHFVTEEMFLNCSVCPRRSCSSRRAIFDAGLYGRLMAR